MKAPGKAGDDQQHRVAEHVAVEDFALRQALRPRRHHILLADLVEERVLGQERGGGEGGKRHRGQRQRQMPEIVDDALRPGKLRPIVGGEAAQREPVEEGSAGEEDDEEDGEQEARHRIGDDDHSGRPDVERRSVPHRLADAERDGDRVGDEHHPQRRARWRPAASPRSATAPTRRGNSSRRNRSAHSSRSSAGSAHAPACRSRTAVPAPR